jgi:hypothetical protein
VDRYLDKRTNVLVLDSTLALHLVEATTVAAVSHALVLKITLATLVANGAVQGVVGQQELHDTLTGLVDEGRVLGARSTSTRHIRQLPAIMSFSW